MRLNSIRTQTNQLDTSLRELRLQLRESAEFRGAHGRVVFGVAEEDAPAVADEVVEIDRAISCLGVEVGRCVTQS